MSCCGFQNFDCTFFSELVIILLIILNGGDMMEATATRKHDEAKLELYSLLEQGYKAMQEGRESSIDEVKERIKKRRQQRVCR